jgi:hypothetical protein
MAADRDAEPEESASREQSGKTDSRVAGLRIWSAVLIVAAVGGFAWFLAGGVDKVVTTDAEAIRAIQETIADVGALRDLRPRMAFRLNSRVFRPSVVAWVCYRDESADLTFVLAQATVAKIVDTTYEQLREDLFTSLEDKGIEPPRIAPNRVATRFLAITGTSTNVRVTEGKDMASGEAAISYFGLFPGKHGNAVLLLWANLGKYPSQRVDALVQSIR